MGIETEYDDDASTPLVSNVQGARSASSIAIKVAHGLDDRTLMFCALLTCVIGFCAWRIGQDQAEAHLNGQYMRDVAVKQQINTNHVVELESQVAILKEIHHAD